jgi:chromosome partitioning protein
MRVVAIANQKGGCGKTTTAISLSFSLASRGKKVLLIDFDPQAHATMGLGVNPSDLVQSIHDVLKPGPDSPPGIDDIVLPIRENFDLAPSKATLSALEQELSGVEGRESRLLRAMESLKKSYDVVIVDCPPSIGHLCFNALRACEEVIIPIDLSLFSLRGVSKLTEIVILLKEKVGHEIKARALVTMYDFRTRYSRRVLEKVREKFGENVFNNAIRYNIRLRETVDYGLPIGEYDKHSLGHKDYEKLAEELMASWSDVAPRNVKALDAARNLLELSEEYSGVSEQPADGEEEFPLAEEAHPPYA